MFQLPLTRVTMDFHLPLIGIGLDSVYTPGEVSGSWTRRVPPPCQEATPKNRAPRAASGGVSCTLTVPVLPSAAAFSLMLAVTLPTLRGSAIATAPMITRPATAMAPSGIARLPLWKALPKPAPSTAAATAVGTASRRVSGIRLAEFGPAGNQPEAEYQIASPTRPSVPTRAPATRPKRSR